MYRLGLLLCDHVPAALRGEFPPYPEMFTRAFAPVAPAITWRVYDLTCGQAPAVIDECDGYITSGSSASAYDTQPWITALEHLVRAIAARGRPLAGVCFGHQVIAQALGGRVGRREGGFRIGVFAHHLVATPVWLQPRLAGFQIPVVHQDEVTDLPAGTTIIASSEQCGHFMLQIGAHLLGVQGHPEFDADYVRALLQRRRELLAPHAYECAVASLDQPHDNLAVLRWIASFLGIA